jgi:hypothetical protein
VSKLEVSKFIIMTRLPELEGPAVCAIGAN